MASAVLGHSLQLHLRSTAPCYGAIGFLVTQNARLLMPALNEIVRDFLQSNWDNITHLKILLSFLLLCNVKEEAGRFYLP